MLTTMCFLNRFPLAENAVYKMHASYIFHSFFWCGIPKEQQELCVHDGSNNEAFYTELDTWKLREIATKLRSSIRLLCRDRSVRTGRPFTFDQGRHLYNFIVGLLGQGCTEQYRGQFHAQLTNWQLKSPPLFLALIVYFVHTFSVQLTPRNKRNLEMQCRSSHILQM